MKQQPISFDQLPSYVYELGRKIDELFVLLKQPATSTAQADEVLTIQQAADFLSIQKQTLYTLVSTGRVPYSKPTGGKLYFSKLALIDWLNGSRNTTITEQVAQHEQKRPARRTRKPGAAV